MERPLNEITAYCLCMRCRLARFWRVFGGFSGPDGVGKGIQALREAAPGLELDAELGTDLSLKGVGVGSGHGRPSCLATQGPFGKV